MQNPFSLILSPSARQRSLRTSRSFGAFLGLLALACWGATPVAQADCREGCSGDNTFLGEEALGVLVEQHPEAVDADDRPEREFEAEFEEAALVTLGLCYMENGRFAGGAYHPVLRRIDKFLGSALPKALEIRRERAARVLELEEAVAEAVKGLKERGFESPYLRAFVVARINPLRFQRGAKADFDETIDKMLAGARRFDAGKVKADQVARASGPPEESGSA